VRGQREMNQVVGACGLLDFTMFGTVLPWRAFWNLWTVYFFNFQNFFRPAVNRGYWIRGSGCPPVLSSRLLNIHFLVWKTERFSFKEKVSLVFMDYVQYCIKFQRRL
jgi:hypothetical protein